MVQDHLDEVWRAALAATGDQAVAEEVTTAVLCAAAPARRPPSSCATRVLAAVRRLPRRRSRRWTRPSATRSRGDARLAAAGLEDGAGQARDRATAYDRAWDARFRGRPVVTLCPYVLAGEDAGERIAHLSGWHDAVLDAEGRIPG
jgi:hypothetical protein